MFKNPLSVNITNKLNDPTGKFIILHMYLQGKKIFLASLYGPNEDMPQFYENLQKQN